jgi:CO/xanthine dehydrogenase Mo-binding subunit
MSTIDSVSVSADEFKHIGTCAPRPDGFEKVTGRARFGADFTLPGMLHGLVLRSPHAHAWLKSIDTSKARALPGVKAIVTRDDGNRSGGRVGGQLPRCGAQRHGAREGAL